MPETNKPFVTELIDFYFRTRQIQLHESSLSYTGLLIKVGVLTSIDDKGNVEINFESTLLYDVLYQYIEKTIGENLPTQLDKVFVLIDSFETKKKEEFNQHTINAYSKLLDGFKSYIICLLHEKNLINIFDFIHSLKKNKNNKYEKYVFDALLHIIDDEQKLHDVITILDSLHYTRKFCKSLVTRKQNLAHKLYEYTLSKNKGSNIEYHLISWLFLNLFSSDNTIALLEVKKLFPNNSSIAYFVLGRLLYTKEEDIVECFDFTSKIDKEDVDSLYNVPYWLTSLIGNSNTPLATQQKCFSIIEDLFALENDKLRNEIFTSCQYIEGHEEERYRLLVETFLNKMADGFNRLADYFQNFKCPSFFFHLYNSLCRRHYKIRTHINIKIFSSTFSNFWDEAKNETEQELLHLLTQDIPYYRLTAVDLIRSYDIIFYELDLTKLDSGIKQLRALEALFHTYYRGIEDLVPLVLTLKNSSHLNVVSYLQKRLSELIYESYHDYLYEKIAMLVPDQEFLAPLKNSLDNYHEYRKHKLSIDDLNPNRNEHELMELYYSLEHEAQQILMKKVREDSKDSFLSFLKTSTIIRGNSFKNLDGTVVPLGKIEKSVAIDIKMYKNPDLFEHYQTNFISEF